MPVYSPPVTRQKARALIIAQQQQQQQQQRADRREDEQRKLQTEQVRLSDRRLRPQQQRSATGKKAEEGGGRNSEPEKALARRNKGAGGESSRPRTRGASHARAFSEVEGRVGSLAAAERPVRKAQSSEIDFSTPFFHVLLHLKNKRLFYLMTNGNKLSADGITQKRSDFSLKIVPGGG